MSGWKAAIAAYGTLVSRLSVLVACSSSSSTVPASQVSATPSAASSSREFSKFSGDQDTVDGKSGAYIRNCMTKQRKKGNIQG